MENREIKNNNVSLLGMGCMRLPLIPNTEEIDFKKTEEMIAYAMKKGEKWRISIQAAAENLKTYRMSLKLNMPNMGQIYIPIDNGTYDYRKFETEFEVMSDSPNFDIILGGKGPSGKIWFDDIKFERVK